MLGIYKNVYLCHLLRAYGVWTILVYSFLAASLFWLFVNPPWKIVEEQYPPEQWMQFFGFAVSSVLIPHSLCFTGVRYVTASRAIIAAMAGSFFIVGEVLTHKKEQLEALAQPVETDSTR